MASWVCCSYKAVMAKRGSPLGHSTSRQASFRAFQMVCVTVRVFTLSGPLTVIVMGADKVLLQFFGDSTQRAAWLLAHRARGRALRVSLFIAFQTSGGVIKRTAFLTRSVLRVFMKMDTASSGSCCPAFGLV